jgi:hypothetical protein
MRTSSHSSEAKPKEKETTLKLKSALRGLIQRLSLTLLACTFAIGATEAQQVAPPISAVIGKVQSSTGSSLDVQTPSGVVHVDVKQQEQLWQAKEQLL